MKKLSFILLLIGLGQGLNAQYISSVMVPDTTVAMIADSNDYAIQLANTITAEDLESHLSILASDLFEGRETGEPGNEMAANYIAEHFDKLGLPKVGLENTYFQQVSFNKTGWNTNEMVINGNKYKHLWDYMSFATMNDELPNFSPNEVIFLGFGIDDPKYSDYKGNNVEGKVIMINKGEPLNKDSISYITGTKAFSDWNDNVWKKLEVAQTKGAKMVLVIENELKQFLDKNRRFLVSPSLRLGDGSTSDKKYANHAYISSTMAKDIIGGKAKKIKRWRKKNTKKGKACDIKLKPTVNMNLTKNIDVISGQNVMGFIEGTDLKDEIVVVSAHYDHLGKRGPDVFNGADDNGSGTSTVLELAEALAKAKAEGNGPGRSVLCLLVTGEEKGLLGSEYYAENPVYPIENTVVNVNIDMVGRTDKKYEDNP
ncbi:MAG: M28 family peptidase, partial [Saprospiraceae bacterium]|nr:M28 family peptidase [Bacteroidia bacterium]NNL93633.1 M28 family peptidase [Saprospiraceae bacterium]